MKARLASKHLPRIAGYLTDGVLDIADLVAAQNSVHTEAVRRTISSLDANPLLGTTPPPVANSEKHLTRKQRSTLAQLWSGQCHLLGDYQVLLGCSTSAVCPESLLRRHTVKHLFDCDATPTPLTIY